MHEQVTPVRTYLLVTVALLALTALTVGASFIPSGPLHIPIALAIAAAKAVLVVLFFMHARYSTTVTRLVIIVALVWLGILLIGVVDDYLTRGWLGVPGH